MPVNDHWRYQGRQFHQWFGHGTAPKENGGATRSGSLFDPASIAQRLEYAIGQVIGTAEGNERSRWEMRLGESAQESLKTLVAAWYGGRAKSRDTFRGQLLDPHTGDETVDQLRKAAEGIVEGRTREQVGMAGGALASAAFSIGLDAWPRFMGNAQRRAMDAVAAQAIPGVVTASATGMDSAIAASGGILLGLLYLLMRSTPTPNPAVGRPMKTEQSPPIRKDENTPSPAKPELAKAGEAILTDDRRDHILNGDGKGGGGHGPGRGTPGKSEFPSGWSDDKAVQAIKDVANDPASVRVPAAQGRTEVRGTKDGVEIKVIVGADGKTIVTAYPTNVPRNGR